MRLALLSIVLVLAAAAVAQTGLSYTFSLADPDIRPGAIELNDDGHLVYTRVINGTSTAYIWSESDGVRSLVEELARPAPIRARAINDLGQVIGTITQEQNELAVPFIFDGEVKPLPTLGGTQTAPAAINNKGQVVGWALTRDGQTRAFVVTGGKIRDLGTAGERTSAAVDINDSGWIVGHAGTDKQKALVWKPNQTRPIVIAPPNGFAEGTAYAINDAGVVLIHFSNVANGRREGAPYTWSETEGLKALPHPGKAIVRTHAINNRGEILLSTANDAKAQHDFYLVVEGELQALPAPNGATEWRYTGLNDQGWLCGDAVVNGERRAFLAKPAS